MANYVVRGVPLYSSPHEQLAGRGWVQTSDPVATLGSLREISQGAEEVFGVGLGSGLVDALLWLDQMQSPSPAQPARAGTRRNAGAGKKR